tara:strand:- start:134 stop:484 length:351 start_codon:yes stop_codon:yes gene_type:complete
MHYQYEKLLENAMSSLADLFRAEVTLRKEADDGYEGRVQVFNVNDIKRYYNIHSSAQEHESAKAGGKHLSYVYFLNSDNSYDCEGVKESVGEIKSLIRDAEDERITRIQKARLQIA